MTLVRAITHLAQISASFRTASGAGCRMRPDQEEPSENQRDFLIRSLPLAVLTQIDAPLTPKYSVLD